MGKRINQVAKDTGLTALFLTMGIFITGTVTGIESNLRPFSSEKITDTSFTSYLEQAKNQLGDNNGSYLVAICTYPGARIGVAIHNSNISE